MNPDEHSLATVRLAPDEPPLPSSLANVTRAATVTPMEPLPDFANPPVVETILSARFREVPRFGSARVGEFWSTQLSSEFPEVEEKAPYGSRIESLGTNDAVTLQVQLTQSPPVNRSWFIGDNQVVQLQSDWVAFNWRKTDLNPSYIRYPSVRPKFEELLGKLDSYLLENLGQRLELLQAEVSYVNHIVLTEDEAEHGPLAAVFRDISVGGDGFLPHAEQSRLQISYPMRSGSNLVGRLHLEAHTVLDRGAAPFVRMVLTARGRPATSDVKGALSFCDLGREWVVRGFHDLTTAAMHIRWGLKEEEAR